MTVSQAQNTTYTLKCFLCLFIGCVYISGIEKQFYHSDVWLKYRGLSARLQSCAKPAIFFTLFMVCAYTDLYCYLNSWISHCIILSIPGYSLRPAGIILYMHPANKRRCYNVMSSLIGWANTQNDHWPWDTLLLNHHQPQYVHNCWDIQQ